MNLLKKKNTLTQTISFMALFAAVNVILSFISDFIPFFSVLLVIFLPLTSTIVEMSCKDRYFPIYFFGTLGLCLAVTFWNIGFAIFYIVPSMITGYLFGLMAKNDLPPVVSIFAAVISQTLLSFVFIPLIELLTDRNLINDVLTILKLQDNFEIKSYIPLIIFAFSNVQIILSYFVVYFELKKFEIPVKKPWQFKNYILYIPFVTTILSIILFFINKDISYLFVGFTVFFTVFILLKSIYEREFKKLIIFGFIILINIFFFAIINPLISDGQFLLIQFSPLFIALISLLNI